MCLAWPRSVVMALVGRPNISQRLILMSFWYVAAFVGGDGHLLCDVATDALVVRQ